MKKLVIASLFFSLLLVSAMAWGQKFKAERITNGPVVKEETRDSAEISWSTDAPGSSIVKYGTSRNALNDTAE